MNESLANTIEELYFVKKECTDLLQRLSTFSSPPYSETFRLVSTPMLYSAWERCFTLCHSIALRLIRNMTIKANDLNAPQKAAWLLQTPFYQSLVSKLRTQELGTEEKRIKKGNFSILCDFLPEFDGWLLNALDRSINTDNLVMTFSNVNPDVVSINARALGISDFPPFKAIKFGRLHDLVGLRNGIGHGAVIQAPSNATFQDLWDFTEALIKEYCNVFIEWIRAEFSDDTEEESAEDIGMAMSTSHW